MATVRLVVVLLVCGGVHGHSGSEQDEEPRALLPFLRRSAEPAPTPAPASAPPTPAPGPLHPNDILFPLIYRQSHINSMFKFGHSWYTWSGETRADGSRAISYYTCHDEPRRCDEVGWERTDSVPRCAFEIDSVLPDDRACLNTFGVEPRSARAPLPSLAAPAAPASPATLCDGADQMKVSEVVRTCGARLRSLWRFVRVGRRPPDAPKPADVNSLLCEDEEECFLTLEYRIHHDRITFSLHEPTRGQTYKSTLRREQPTSAPAPATEEATERHGRRNRARNQLRLRVKNEPVEGKGVVKEPNDSEYDVRPAIINKIKIHDNDASGDFSVDNQ